MKLVIYLTAFLYVVTASPIFAESQVVVIPLNSSGDSSSAAGSDGQVQYNNAGTVDGAKIYYDETSGKTEFDGESDGSIIISNDSSDPGEGLRALLSSTGNAFIENTSTSGSSLKNMYIRNGTSGGGININHNNYVGINNISPSQLLHIRQHQGGNAIRIQNYTGNQWELGVGSSNYFTFYYNGGLSAHITQAGDYVKGSDQRLKNDLHYMDSVLTKVNKLKPADYHFIGSSVDAPRSIGLVAQEVEQVFPELVRELDDGFKGVVYSGFAVISIKAIQELSAQISEMQIEIDTLKQSLNKRLLSKPF